jgi:integrase
VLEDRIQAARLITGPDEQGRGLDTTGVRQVGLHNARPAFADEDVEPDRLVIDSDTQPVPSGAGQPVAETGQQADVELGQTGQESRLVLFLALSGRRWPRRSGRGTGRSAWSRRGNAWIGDLDLPDLNATIRDLKLQNGTSASGSTKSTVASVLRRLFAWAREERIIPTNPALELRTGWGSSMRRKVIIPSIPQVLRLAAALDHFKPGLGDVAMVLAFTGLRWEEAVAVLIESVDLDHQSITVERTASESGGRRDVREDMKTRAAVRTAMIPDIAMPAVRRLVERHAAGREQTEGRRYGRLNNGERGGYLGYAMWRRYLNLARAIRRLTRTGSWPIPRTNCGTCAPRC